MSESTNRAGRRRRFLSQMRWFWVWVAGLTLFALVVSGAIDLTG